MTGRDYREQEREMIVRPVVVIEESLNKLWSQQHVSCEEYNALPDVTESKYVFSITCCGALITFACHITHNVWIHIAFYSHKDTLSVSSVEL